MHTETVETNAMHLETPRGTLRGFPCAITDLVLHVVDLVVLRVDGADEHVVGDVVQVAAELEPRAGHRDVVRRALALCLQHASVYIRCG